MIITSLVCVRILLLSYKLTPMYLCVVDELVWAAVHQLH